MQFSRCSEGKEKNPSLISRKNISLNNQFWKFCAIYFDFFQNPLLHLLVAVVLPNFCFWVCSFNTNERDKKTFIYQVTWKAFYNQFFKIFWNPLHLFKFVVLKIMVFYVYFPMPFLFFHRKKSLHISGHYEGVWCRKLFNF